MSINIWCKYTTGKIEKIDEADTAKDAAYLVQEYRMAFGPSAGLIWAGTQRQGQTLEARQDRTK